MESVFTPVTLKNTSNNKGKRRSVACCARRTFLSAAMIFCAVFAGGMPVYAWEETGEFYAAGIYSAAAPSQNDLDLGSASDAGDLNTDGYHWNAGAKILELKGVSIRGTLTLPDETVEIKTEGVCSIHTLAIAGGSPQKTKLTFSGTGKLTVEEQINISGGNGNALTVETGAQVTAKGGIAIGSSGGTDSVVTINGTLTAEGGTVIIGGNTYYNSAVSAGKVIVGEGGRLNVSGNSGVILNGMMSSQGDLDFTGVFTVLTYGCFTADCTAFNVNAEGTDRILEDADQVFIIPENYLPADCGVKKSDSGKKVDFVRKDTGQVYTGPMTIHEIHDWSDDWHRDASGHWKECTFSGCGRRTAEAPHSYDGNTWTCICGSKLDVTRRDAEELIYNGREQKPDVTVKVDGTELDASKYNKVYRNNVNAGEASVTVTGKGGLSFECTLKFQIARAVPTITWGSSSQNVIYTGSRVIIDKPSVVLAGGGEFNGEMNYFYKANGSADYISGLPTYVGEYTVKAGINGQNNYTDAESTDLTLTVEKAENAPNMPSDTMKVKKECEKVSDVKLPEKWQWQKTDQDTVLTSGKPTKATAVYVGQDKGNYKNETMVVTITRADGNQITGSGEDTPKQQGDVSKNPRTGWPMTPWWNISIGSLAVMAGIGVLSLVRRKKGEKGR